MRYKVGDKVRVRGDLEVDEKYGNNTFVEGMKKYKGKVVEVKKELCSEYRLGNFRYHWTSEMLRPAEFKIWCETEEEKQAVLEELEKEGYVWVNGGEKPTKWNEIKHAPMGLIVKCGELYQELRDGIHDRIPELTPSEFTEIDFSEKITITKTSTGATASYGDKTVTTEGDFEDASRQALAEVLCPFKVGDELKVIGRMYSGTVEKITNYTKIILRRDSEHKGEYLESELEPCTEPPYNAKLFCIEGHGVFKQGVVYTVENGMFIGVHGSHFMNLEDVNKNLASQFMEVKGGLDE